MYSKLYIIHCELYIFILTIIRISGGSTRRVFYDIYRILRWAFIETKRSLSIRESIGTTQTDIFIEVRQSVKIYILIKCKYGHVINLDLAKI